MKLAKTYGYLKKDLDLIEETLRNSVHARQPVLRQTSEQLLRAGGKRIRPLFVLLSGALGPDKDKKPLIDAAVSIELIHMATLVHDDVIDNASLRRGKPTIRVHYDNRTSMYTGDYILACALESITKIESPDIHRLLSNTIVEVCKGEIEQIRYKFNWEQNLRVYLRRIRRKTAILIATCCKLGALIAGLPEKSAAKLFKYGYYLGMSYQIIDDILDFTASAKQLGKPSGNDLLQGNITLPILEAMKDAEFAQLVRKTIELGASTKDIRRLVDTMNRLGAIERSYEMSNRYLQKALDSLSEFEDTKEKRTLIDIAAYMGKRSF